MWAKNSGSLTELLFLRGNGTVASVIAVDRLFGAAAGFALSATEGADSFSGELVGGQSLTLASTESADTFSASLVAGGSLSLAATESADTFSGQMVGGNVLALAATEGADTFAGALAATPANNEFVLAATEGPDTASMEAAEAAETERPTGGVGRKNKRRGIEVVDVIWPDDPRHPSYVGPVNDNAPKKKEPVVIKVKPAAEQAKPAVQNAYDPNIAALLLLAA